METDQAIGTALPAIMAGVTIETDSSALSTAGSSAMVRLDDNQLTAMTALANSPLPALPRCSDDQFNKSMRAMSMLPRRGDDETTGELRVEIYQAMLGHYPNAAIRFLSATALAELEWFPSPKQCLEILARWKRNDGEGQKRTRSAAMVRAEHQARFDEIMGRLERREFDETDLAALPARILGIGAERGFLRLHDDGVYRARLLPVPTDG